MLQLGNVRQESPDHGIGGTMSATRTQTIASKLTAGICGALVAAAILGAATDQAQAGGMLAIAFEDASFTGAPEVIDNEYWPLNPDGDTGFGRTFTFIGETPDGCEMAVAQVLGLTTLDGAAPYTGFVTVQVEDVAYFDENCTGNTELSVKHEHTFDWYRQDDNGNIWYLGELSRVYDREGCFDDALPSAEDMLVHPDCYSGSWEAGKGPEGGLVAEAGILVPSDFPEGIAGAPLTPGTFYLQELAEEAMDTAKVLKTDAKVKYKIDGVTQVFRHCRVTKEYSSLAPGAVEQKNYCPDDGGLALIEEFHGGQTVLVELVDITPPLP